jgi:hypothetical protein
MATSKEERVLKLQALAAEFREFAAQTNLPSYRVRMLDMAVEMDREAARLQGGHPLSAAS